jgi:hypothetical protein
MYHSCISILAIFAASAVAKRCINMTVPVDISARTDVFNLNVPQTNLDATDFIRNQTQLGQNFTSTVLTATTRLLGDITLAPNSVCHQMVPAAMLLFKF